MLCETEQRFKPGDRVTWNTAPELLTELMSLKVLIREYGLVSFEVEQVRKSTRHTASKSPYAVTVLLPDGHRSTLPEVAFIPASA